VGRPVEGAFLIPDISAEAQAAVQSLYVTRAFAAGEFLLRAGERAVWCFAIARGLVRELYVDEDGVEHTRAFMREGEITGSLLDLLANRDAVTFIQAIEPTHTFAFRYRELDALCARYPELHVVLRRSAEALYVKKARREHEMLALSARERYERWRAGAGDLDERVTRKHLASYLGITPEHLSRIARARSRKPRAEKR
jgi:CRP-like cAMP-binding protein